MAKECSPGPDVLGVEFFVFFWNLISHKFAMMIN